MADFTLKGFFVSCVVSGITYLISNTKYDLEEGLALILICYIAGLISYFAYLGFKKEGVQWNGEEIFAGFLASAVVQWVPLFLMFFLI